MIRFILKAIVTGLLVMAFVYFVSKGRFNKKELALLGGIVIAITFVLDYSHGLIGLPMSMVSQVISSKPISNTLTQEELPNMTEPVAKDWEHTVPFMFQSTAPEVPVPHPPVIDQYSEINGIGGRWNEWKKLMQKNTKPLNHNTQDYKLFYGYYAEEIATPVQNEPVLTMEDETLAPKDYPTNNPLDQAVWPATTYGVQNFELTGGANPVDATPTTTTVSQKLESKVASSTLGSMLHPSNTDMGIRMSNVIYSGDMIDMVSGTSTLQRDSGTSRVVLKSPILDVGTNLSKLHFEDLSTNGQGNMIRYGDPIRIGHVALINNTNKRRYIKYGERVQSHQEGPQYAIFRLVHEKQPNTQTVVKYGDNFKISCGYQQGDKTFLKMETDGSLSSESTFDQSTVFHLNLLKPYNTRQSNLCICPNESIFP